MYSRPGADSSRFGARPTGANSFRLRSDENRRPNFGQGAPSPGSADVDMKDASPATGRFRTTPTSASSSTSSHSRQALRERTTAGYRATSTSALHIRDLDAS
eukprot:jgi/Phyca11/509649/fgenesh2_kg.PHYCAscaffold_48_\